MLFDDILNEVCKGSAMKAMSALSRFLQRPIAIAKQTISVHSFFALELIDSSYRAVASSFIPIKGDVQGAALLLFSKEAALNLCDLLLNRALGQTTDFCELEISALSEIANICIGNFLTSFADALQLELLSHQISIFDNCQQDQLNQKVRTFFESSKEPYTKIDLTFQLNHIQGSLSVLLDQYMVSKAMDKILNASCMRAHHQ